MKRIDSHDGDDREAEYDGPETIQAITRAIESHGHTVIGLEATPDFPRDSAAAEELADGLPFIDLEVVEAADFALLVERYFVHWAGR